MEGDEAFLQATSGDVAGDGSASVALRWEAVDEVVGYNLYRRLEGTPRKELPINGRTPIAPPTTGRRFREIVAEGTPEWHALAHGFGALTAGTGSTASHVDPAERFERGLTANEFRLLRAGAQANLVLGRVAGLAYLDRDVKAGESYLYELRGVREDASETVLAVDIPVQVGRFVPPDPPSGVIAQAGDRRALVLWNRNPYANSYIVQRNTSPGGHFQRVNPSPVANDRAHDIDGGPLSPPRPGYLDIGAWDVDGMPTTHDVQGLPVSGPDNGITYWYKVASCDIFDRAGPWSTPVAVTPVRSLPPMAPDSLSVEPTPTADGLVLTWGKVTRNVENHYLPDAWNANYVYRSENREALEKIANLPTCLVATCLVATVTSHPMNTNTTLVTWTDNDPVLIPPHGAKPYFYCVRVADPYGNLSAPSAVISGTVPDTRPPGPTDLIGVKGAANYIRVEWRPNQELDLAGYQIYRGLCDRGTIYRRETQDRYGCDMTLVGEVPLGQAQEMWAAKGRIRFDDYSVPANSPLCYGYWVRAYDLAGNLYSGADSGCPKEGEYRCGRLREKTAPPVPVLTGLHARNKGVLVEWVSSPVQDLRAFHVYRSDAEFDPPKFLACVFIDGTVSAAPWGGLTPSCADVPAVPDPLAARGSYLDVTAKPHHVYWYRVTALDWLGNESQGSSIHDIPASSTFTYTSDLPTTPNVLDPVAPAVTGSGLDIRWTPIFDPAVLQGFVVFRAAPGGDFRQVSGIVAANAFTDPTARRGVDYEYLVQSMDRIGMLSLPSPAVRHRY